MTFHYNCIYNQNLQINVQAHDKVYTPQGVNEWVNDTRRILLTTMVNQTHPRQSAKSWRCWMFSESFTSRSSFKGPHDLAPWIRYDLHNTIAYALHRWFVATMPQLTYRKIIKAHGLSCITLTSSSIELSNKIPKPISVSMNVAQPSQSQHSSRRQTASSIMGTSQVICQEQGVDGTTTTSSSSPLSAVIELEHSISLDCKHIVAALPPPPGIAKSFPSLVWPCTP